MLTQIRAARADVDQLLSQFGDNAGALAEARTQGQLLATLERNLASGNQAALAAARGEIAGAVAATANLGQQLRGAAESRANLDVARAQTRARATVQRIAGDLFERRVFDPYLRFGSTEEEAEYRRREAEREQYIRRELARDTPQGNLNAANATVAQIEDAGAHGANRSPEYGRLRAEAANARDDQMAAMRAAQVSPDSNSADAQQVDASPADLAEIAAVFRTAGVRPAPAGSAPLSGHRLGEFAVDRGGNAVSRHT